MAAIVAIQSTNAHELAGFLVAGISSRLRFDDSYRGFLELVSAQIASAIANSRAYEAERKRNEALAEIADYAMALRECLSHSPTNGKRMEAATLTHISSSRWTRQRRKSEPALASGYPGRSSKNIGASPMYDPLASDAVRNRPSA